MVMIWSWFDGGWEPSTLFRLLQRTATSHDALIKPAPMLLMVLFVQDSVSAGVWEHVSVWIRRNCSWFSCSSAGLDDWLCFNWICANVDWTSACHTDDDP